MDVAWQFSDRHIVRSFLQLDNLLIDELALLMDDKVRVHGALCRLLARLRGASTCARQTDSGKATSDSDVLRMLAVAALDVQGSCL